MTAFFIKTEAKLFCMLIAGFLYFFSVNNPSFGNTKNNNYMYMSFVAGIILSITGGILTSFFASGYIHNLYNVLTAVCFAVSANCLCNTLFASHQTAKVLNKVVYPIIAAIYGCVCFTASKSGVFMPVYILLYVMIIVFSLSQYNKIRIDNLTKLYNRYGMDAEIKEQLRQYERENSNSFYIIACDLDNFKHINDTWGHLEGDRALVLIADTLAKIGKMFDAEVFRIGGDEFVIITDTSEEELAVNITDALKKEIDKIDFRDDFDIKMSIGVALYDGITPIDELLNNADKKLYEAKRKTKQE